MSSLSTAIFPIQHLFPREGYLEACKGDKSLTPIYLIALKQPNSMVCKQYGKKDPSYAEPRFKLTALAVATMMGNHEVMKYLLGRGVDRAPVDRGGLTPLHYACALKDTKSMQLLGEARTVYEIFPGWKRVINPEIPKDDEVVIHHKDTSGKVVPLTASQFQALTGAHFYNGVSTSSEQAVVDLLTERLKKFENVPDGPTLNTFIEGHVRSLFDAFVKAPPKLYLAPQSPGVEGVFAGQDFSIGSIVTVYGGEVGKKVSSKRYLFDNIDASNLRNAGGMINDGFPNLTVTMLPLPDGRFYMVFLALEDIKKNDPLFYNYSLAHSVKRVEPHRELNPQKLEAFVQQFTFGSPFNRIEHLKRKAQTLQTIESGLEYVAIAEHIKYLFQTPSSLYALLLKGVLTKEQLLPLKGNEEFLQFAANSDEDSCAGRVLCEMFFSHLGSLSYLFENKSDEAGELRKMLQRFLEVYPFRVVLPLLNYLATDGCKSWKEELVLFPDLMKGTTFLFSLSREDEIDPTAFLTAFSQIGQIESYRNQVFPMLMQIAPHLLSSTQKILQAS